MKHGVIRIVAAASVCAAAGLAGGRADASPASRARTQDAYALAYDLRFAECYDALEQAAKADPLDPAPRRAIAAVTWIEILFAQGVATFEAFTGELSKKDIVRPATPPLLASRFRDAIAQAKALADQQLARADSPDAHYQVGTTAAVAALYRATVEGRTLGAFSEGRRAVAAMERARGRDGGRRETALILGMSQYAVSTMAWPARMMARLSGLSGDRAAGLALLKEAAMPGTETESDALLLLMIVDHREGRPADALERLKQLQRLHPRNRLLWLNQGASALAAHQPADAERALSQGIMGKGWEAEPAVLGESAMWFAHRGAARAQLHRSAEAAADLQQGLALNPRDWVRGRIHRELGDLALSAGDRNEAKRQFEEALRFSERGGDAVAVAETRRKLSAVKR